MKLVPKLAMAFVAGTFCVLAVNGYFRIEREVSTLQADRAHDHALLGGALGAAVVNVWHSDGRADALKVVAGANERSRHVLVRWIDPDAPEPSLHASPTDLAGLGASETLTRVGDDKRYSYTGVVVDGRRVGFLELSESLDAERRAKRTIVADTLRTTFFLVVVCGALSLALGIWLVGRPVRALCDKARRIGEGDFGGPLALTQQDELGMLAVEVNAMSERLFEANRRAERETAARIATLEQLRHADRLMTVGMLASGIAHELGTPLNVVSARAKMMLAGDCSEAETRDYARVIAEAADRMAKIIRQLLAFARRKSPQKAPRDLGRIAAETCDLLRPLATRNKVELELAPPPAGAAPAVAVDGDGIQQALTNIVVNAIHAMPSGGKVELMIDRETRPRADEHPGSFAVVRVKDHGTGIAKEHLERVFEPFFTTKGVGQGTGLGLSVTLGIVQDHGGFIDVESETGKGTMFAIHLPLEEPA